MSLNLVKEYQFDAKRILNTIIYQEKNWLGSWLGMSIFKRFALRRCRCRD